MEIAGCTALVSGGGSGLGAATARQLASLGARVAVLDRNGEAAKVIAATIDGLAFAADVTDPAAIEAAIAEATRHFGEAPRIVVNCAGIGTAQRILPRDGAPTLSAFQKTIEVNLVGTYNVMSLAARAMAGLPPRNADGEVGLIINTASVAYEDGQIGQAAYAASKGGIAAMTLPAARELARFGIRVATIAPGLFETAMTAGLPEESRRAIIANIPFPPRLGRAGEFAALVAHIAANPMINGTVLRLDGAVRLPQK